MANVGVIILLISFSTGCKADIYMHNPRGSNNRQRETTATRSNGARLFNSQNNDRGGYNVGDKFQSPSSNEEQYYRMVYFESGSNLTESSRAGRSELVIEWTNQHGCGGNEDTDPQKANCNIVIQYYCQEDSTPRAPRDGFTIRDGIDARTIPYTDVELPSKLAADRRRLADVHQNYGLQEPWFWHDACSKRERNKGLFTATQNLESDKATFTRQNPGGARSGYECSEERDYYPYWHPTPFIDIAILAQNESFCEYYEKHSFNRRHKYECVQNFTTGKRQHYSTLNNEESCRDYGGEWTKYYSMLELAPTYTSREECEDDHGDGLSYKWGKPWDIKKINNHEHITEVCFVQPPKIDCKAAGWTRSNHLGNGRDGYPLNYTWTIPHFPSANHQRCVLRIRYNISTDDYDSYNINASSNGDNSPVQDNPKVVVGENEQKLQLTLNTAQTGRTFQDRSHVFEIRNRPSGITNEQRIHNLNVRGKRGNIVQVFPAVEYDFVPNRLVIKKGDAVHIQWTGSNTHFNNGNGGDGQAGSAGQGKPGTDRNNLVQCLGPDQNYPVHDTMMDMLENTTCLHNLISTGIPPFENMTLALATSAYYHCFDGCEKSPKKLAALHVHLDTSHCSFAGYVIRFNEKGKYYYICTRNNSFTNRSQKGCIEIE